MPPPVARVGDSCAGVCFAHDGPIGVSGTIVSGSPTSTTDGAPTARIGDTAVFSCGHSGSVVSGASTSTTDGVPTARIGDSVVGPMIASITSGSPTSQAQ
jgi:uncharacterized Zn-binding protein involved in type VI secretion